MSSSSITNSLKIVRRARCIAANSQRYRLHSQHGISYRSCLRGQVKRDLRTRTRRPALTRTTFSTATVSMHALLECRTIQDRACLNRDQATRFKVEAKSLTTDSKYFTANFRFNMANSHKHGKLEFEDDDLGALHVWCIYMQAWKREGAAEMDSNNHAKRRLDSHQDRAAGEALLLRPWVARTDTQG
jgi:hypothetical protein